MICGIPPTIGRCFFYATYLPTVYPTNIILLAHRRILYVPIKKFNAHTVSLLERLFALCTSLLHIWTRQPCFSFFFDFPSFETSTYSFRFGFSSQALLKRVTVVFASRLSHLPSHVSPSGSVANLVNSTQTRNRRKPVYPPRMLFRG